jgi:hypothetical protein
MVSIDARCPSVYTLVLEQTISWIYSGAVRPMLLGSGEQLGLYPSPEFSLLFYVSPTVSESLRVMLESRVASCGCVFSTLY